MAADAETVLDIDGRFLGFGRGMDPGAGGEKAMMGQLQRCRQVMIWSLASGVSPDDGSNRVAQKVQLWRATPMKVMGGGR